MGRSALTSMLVLLVAAGASAYAAESRSADEQAIAKMEQAWAKASATKDKAFFEANLSDDFTFITEDGDFSDSRAEYIDGIIMKMPKITDEAVTDETIRVHGSTAVATGRWAGKVGSESSAVRYTDTFAKGPNGWKAIASQETRTK